MKKKSKKAVVWAAIFAILSLSAGVAGGATQFAEGQSFIWSIVVGFGTFLVYYALLLMLVLPIILYPNDYGPVP